MLPGSSRKGGPRTNFSLSTSSSETVNVSSHMPVRILSCQRRVVAAGERVAEPMAEHLVLAVAGPALSNTVRSRSPHGCADRAQGGADLLRADFRAAGHGSILWCSVASRKISVLVALGASRSTRS